MFSANVMKILFYVSGLLFPFRELGAKNFIVCSCHKFFIYNIVGKIRCTIQCIIQLYSKADSKANRVETIFSMLSFVWKKSDKINLT